MLRYDRREAHCYLNPLVSLQQSECMSVRLLSSPLKAFTSLIFNRLVMGLKPQQIDLYGLKT